MPPVKVLVDMRTEYISSGSILFISKLHFYTHLRYKLPFIFLRFNIRLINRVEYSKQYIYMEVMVYREQIDA